MLRCSKFIFAEESAVNNTNKLDNKRNHKSRNLSFDKSAVIIPSKVYKVLDPET